MGPPASARIQVSQPAVVLLPWVPPATRRPAMGVRHELLPGLERDAGPRGSQEAPGDRARSRSGPSSPTAGPGGPRRCGPGRGPLHGDADGLQGLGVRRGPAGSQPVTIAPAARAWSAAAEAPAPAMPRMWMRSPGADRSRGAGRCEPAPSSLTLRVIATPARAATPAPPAPQLRGWPRRRRTASVAPRPAHRRPSRRR